MEHWDTEGPQQEAQELWQAEEEKERRNEEMKKCRGGRNKCSAMKPKARVAPPTSAPAVGVQVVVSRAVGNTLPMMQGGPGHAAHALGVVRETGGTRRIAGCEVQRVAVHE